MPDERKHFDELQRKIEGDFSPMPPPIKLTAAEQIAQFRARRKLKLVTRSLKQREKNMSRPVPEDSLEGRASAIFLRGVFEMQRLREYQTKLRDQLP